MTASSYTTFLAATFPFHGRLHDTRYGGLGWCAELQSLNDWLQVDLGKAFKVCGVATQGGGSSSLWVTDFKLNYSSDGNAWTTYKYENGTEAVSFHFIYDSSARGRSRELFIFRPSEFLKKIIGITLNFTNTKVYVN